MYPNVKRIFKICCITYNKFILKDYKSEYNNIIFFNKKYCIYYKK